MQYVDRMQFLNVKAGGTYSYHCGVKVNSNSPIQRKEN